MLGKVLIVDDSELMHTMYQLVLRKYPGCSTIKALDGQKALNILEKENGINLIFLDINMPVMDGIEFLEAIQNKSRLANIPIVVISTASREKDLNRCIELGAKAYMVKPFKSSLLYETIDSLVGKSVARVA